MLDIPDSADSDMGPEAGPALNYIMQICGVKRGSSPTGVIRSTLNQGHPDNVLRRARRNQDLSPGSLERLETEAVLTVFADDRLAWDVKFAGLREAVLQATLPRLERFYEGKVQELVGRSANNPTELTFATYISSLVAFRSHKLAPEAKAKSKYLRIAHDRVGALAEAAARAGSQVSPLFASIAAVNKVAFDWQLLLSSGRQDSFRCELTELCRRGRAVAGAAADRFPFWVAIRRDEIEYSGLLQYLDPSAESLAHLDEALRRLAKANVGVVVEDLLLMLRTNMEPAARVAIKSSAVYQRIKLMAAVASGNPAARITQELIDQLEHYQP